MISHSVALRSAPSAPLPTLSVPGTHLRCIAEHVEHKHVGSQFMLQDLLLLKHELASYMLTLDMLEEQQTLRMVSSVSGMQIPHLSKDWVRSHALTAGKASSAECEPSLHVSAEKTHTLVPLPCHHCRPLLAPLEPVHPHRQGSNPLCLCR